MVRALRIHEPQLLFHIMTRGNNGQKIFNSPKDYRSFLTLLRTTKKQYPFKLYAYALMPNHIHLLVEVGEKPSGRIMQSLLTAYARYYNYVHKRTGHLFQGRYKAILCQKDAYAMELVRYIHLNPVRAHLCKSLGQWKWTGHGEYCGVSKQNFIDRGVVAELFGKGVVGVRKYSGFIADGLGCTYSEELHPSDAAPFLGDDRFVEEVTSKQQKSENKQHKSLHDIVIAELRGLAVRPELIFGKSRKKEIASVRKRVIQLAILDHGYKAADLARQLSCSEAYISKVLS